MCYQYGSVEHHTSVCPMCKVFRPSAAKCPHKIEICKNSSNHAKDVVYIKNAEVQTFNGCGYCKWAKANPTKVNPFQNPGWAGCCRPPRDSERVPPADWPAVSTVHNIPVPPEIRSMLDSIHSTARAAAKASAAVPATTTPDRRTSPANVAARLSPRTQPLAIPAKVRANVSTNGARNADGALVSKKDSPPERATRDSPNTPSPLRRHIELEGSVVRPTDRRSSVSRVPGKGSSTANASGGNVDVNATPPSLRRRASTADARRQATSSERRAPERAITSATVATRSGAGAPPKRSSLDIDFSGLSLAPATSGSALSPLSPGAGSSSEGGGSDARSVSGGSSSDGTVTSDGGFTDYLSDESEAELQRQAEARAAVLAQNQMEDLEFKAARKQLAHVDLRPPRAWNAGGAGARVEPVGYGRSR